MLLIIFNGAVSGSSVMNLFRERNASLEGLNAFGATNFELLFDIRQQSALFLSSFYLERQRERKRKRYHSRIVFRQPTLSDQNNSQPLTHRQCTADSNVVSTKRERDFSRVQFS